MPTVERSSGLRLTFPSMFEPLEDVAGKTGLRGSRSRSTSEPRIPATAAEATDEMLLAALRNTGMEVAGSEELLPTRPAQVRGRRSAESGDIELTLPVEGGEEVVVLTEQDGVYAWSYPAEADASAGATVAEYRTRGGGGGTRTFRVALPEGPARTPGTTRGLVGDALIAPVRMFVMRFAARAVTGRVMQHLERGVRSGIVRITSPDLATWTLADDRRDALALPKDRPARLLLLMHGTFSSTAGAFGALCAFPYGRAFLERASAAYDAVLGMDHRTLSADPLGNARDLLEFLRTLDLAYPPTIDFLTHSRGGLVYRSFAEHLVPGVAERLRPRTERAVFVGVPNAGTTLADPEHWRSFIDLYTNIAVGACRVIGRIPQVRLVTTVLSEAIQGMSALVQALARQALESGDVPGLAAMRPGGDFIRELNAEQRGSPRPGSAYYCAVTSEFKASLRAPHQPSELPHRLLAGLVDRVSDRLLREGNDLVVNTSSMTAIDGARTFIKDHVHFDRTPQVYHTNYFARPEVVAALERWLELGAAATAVPDSISRTRLPVCVDDDILVTTADATVAELQEQAGGRSPTWVVVRRPHDGRVLSCAFRWQEVEQKAERLSRTKAYRQGRWKSASLQTVLDIRNDIASIESPISEATRIAGEKAKDETTGSGDLRDRVVILDGEDAVGVIAPGEITLPSSDDLVNAASGPGYVATFSYDVLSPAAPAPHDPSPTREKGRTRGGRTRDSGEAAGGATATVANPQQAIEPQPRPVEAAPAPPRPAADEPRCHFRAEMNATVAAGEVATLAVTVSHEELERAASRAESVAAAGVQADRRIVLDIRPRRNFRVEGPSRAELDPPDRGRVVERFFDLRATDVGQGEVWVTVRQGIEQLAVLRLSVTVTEARPATRAAVRADVTAREARPVTEPFCQLRIFEHDSGSSISHVYELQVPGRIFETYTSEPIRTDRNAYVNSIYREIENRWLGVDQDVENFREDVRALGADLFGQLFPPDLQRVLWENRSDIDCIQVISAEPFIPWELIHLKEPGGPLPDESLYLAQLGLVRWLHGSWLPERIRVRPGRAHYVIPEYPDPADALPEAQKEIDFLERHFNAEGVEPQPAAVRRLLRGPGAFDLLHFACHGEAESTDVAHASLLLGGSRAAAPTSAAVTATTVAEHSRLEDAEGNRPLVVLNACKVARMGHRLTRVGGFADAFLRRGAGAFVGSLWSVGDLPARVFTESLYTRLMAGEPLARAASAARREAARDGDATWLAYAVYGHPHLQLVTG